MELLLIVLIVTTIAEVLFMALTRVALVNALNALTAQLSKVDAEVKGLITKIGTLEDTINAGEVSPEVEAALAAVVAQAKVVDDNVPDSGDVPVIGDTLPPPEGGVTDPVDPPPGRRPLLDENGDPVLDENGNPVYE